jgi:CcmD family protein
MEPIYVVLIIILIIWIGIFGYMFHIDKEVTKLTKKIKSLENTNIKES